MTLSSSVRHGVLISKALLYLLTVGIIFTRAKNAYSFDLAFSSEAIHIPNTSYHYLGIDTIIAFPTNEGRFFVQLGATPPYTRSGFQEFTTYFSLGHLFETESSFIRFYGGPAIGCYFDVLNGQIGYTPSIVLNGGIRIGGKSLGLQFGMNTFFGINPFWQFIGANVAWPMTNFTGGIYVAL